MQDKTKDTIIPCLETEVREFEDEVRRFRSGEITDQQFLAFRVRQGVYGQRQPNRQMFRVKIPGGILSADALEVLATLAEQYVPLKKGHLTTRQNIQFHGLRLNDCAEAMRLIARAGLTTREACGNTVRNVVGSPLAGICPDEVFDPTPCLTAYARFAVRHPLTQNFPRKFKTSFSGCDQHDAVASLMHDLSFVARIDEQNNTRRRGFKIFAGGATSIRPRLAEPLYDFIPWEESLRVSLAVWTVFNNADELRKNRMRARLKALIDRIGMEAFKEQVDRQFVKIDPIDPTPLMQPGSIHHESPPAQPPEEKIPVSVEFLRWKDLNCQEQKQSGYHAVHVKVPQGDLTSTQIRVLADLVRRYTGGRARTTQEQNLVLRWVPAGYLYPLWQSLNAIGLADRGANGLTDVVACPGTDSCKSAITSSRGLCRALERALSRNGFMDDTETRSLRIKISGCPHGCGHHHIGNIGFQGAIIRASLGREIPAYDLFLRGQYRGKIEETRYGERLRGARVPAQRIQAFLSDILTFYKNFRLPREEFNRFIERVGPDAVLELAHQYQDVSPRAIERFKLDRDHDRSESYRLERGEGECSA